MTVGLMYREREREQRLTRFLPHLLPLYDKWEDTRGHPIRCWKVPFPHPLAWSKKGIAGIGTESMTDRLTPETIFCRLHGTLLILGYWGGWGRGTNFVPFRTKRMSSFVNFPFAFSRRHAARYADELGDVFNFDWSSVRPCGHPLISMTAQRQIYDR